MTKRKLTRIYITKWVLHGGIKSTMAHIHPNQPGRATPVDASYSLPQADWFTKRADAVIDAERRRTQRLLMLQRRIVRTQEEIQELKSRKF